MGIRVYAVRRLVSTGCRVTATSRVLETASRRVAVGDSTTSTESAVSSSYSCNVGLVKGATFDQVYSKIRLYCIVV